MKLKKMICVQIQKLRGRFSENINQIFFRYLHNTFICFFSLHFRAWGICQNCSIKKVFNSAVTREIMQNGNESSLLKRSNKSSYVQSQKWNVRNIAEKIFSEYQPEIWFCSPHQAIMWTSTFMLIYFLFYHLFIFIVKAKNISLKTTTWRFRTTLR